LRQQGGIKEQFISESVAKIFSHTTASAEKPTAIKLLLAIPIEAIPPRLDFSRLL
jgi:hypothetical protein